MFVPVAGPLLLTSGAPALPDSQRGAASPGSSRYDDGHARSCIHFASPAFSAPCRLFHRLLVAESPPHAPACGSLHGSTGLPPGRHCAPLRSPVAPVRSEPMEIVLIRAIRKASLAGSSKKYVTGSRPVFSLTWNSWWHRRSPGHVSCSSANRRSCSPVTRYSFPIFTAFSFFALMSSRTVLTCT